ncbi:MAG: hypothetical protein WCJ26_15325 [bacterium]
MKNFKSFILVILISGILPVWQAVQANPSAGPCSGPKATITAVSVGSCYNTVDFPVTVTSFTNVGSLALTFGYDQAKMTDPAIVSRNAAFEGKWGAFSVTTNPDGTYKISGYGPGITDGVTLTNGSVLLILRFNIVGSTSAATLSFVENIQGTACEFAGVAPTFTPFCDTPTGSFYFSGNLTRAPALAAGISSITHASCMGCSDGSITASVSGGTPSYGYHWNNGQSLATASGLSRGNYAVTVTDGAGCTATASATVTQPGFCTLTLAGPETMCQNTGGNVYTTETGMINYEWTVSPGGVITAGGTAADHSVTVTWTGAGAQSVMIGYTTPTQCYPEPVTLYVQVNPVPSTLISGASTVTQGQTVTYSTPYNSGNSYTWNASHGNPELCFPNRNCLTLTWDFPCGIINPGYVRVTETDQATGCSATATEWITIVP